MHILCKKWEEKRKTRDLGLSLHLRATGIVVIVGWVNTIILLYRNELQ